MDGLNIQLGEIVTSCKRWQFYDMKFSIKMFCCGKIIIKNNNLFDFDRDTWAVKEPIQVQLSCYVACISAHNIGNQSYLRILL